MRSHPVLSAAVAFVVVVVVCDHRGGVGIGVSVGVGVAGGHERLLRGRVRAVTEVRPDEERKIFSLKSLN